VIFVISSATLAASGVVWILVREARKSGRVNVASGAGH
jgi:hypothetical protein